MPFLSVASISKRAGVFNINAVSFTQNALQKLAIAGATGSGKSTLLKIIAGLVQPDAGTIFFEDKKVPGPEETLIPGHPRIAYLSQHFELRNHYRVEEELSYTNQLAETDAASIFEVCRITHLLRRWTHQLSGGERQRIAMARQLIAAPQLFLLDEPFSNLDQPHKELIKKVIHDIGAKLSITCILVSHDPADLLSWADEIMILENGNLIQKGKPEEVYYKPVNAYAAGLLGPYNLITPEQLPLFKSLLSTAPIGKNVLIRPEQIKITEAGAHAIKGTIKEILFFGSWYEAVVAVGDSTVVVKTSVTTLEKGDSIYITLSEGDVWYVDR